LAFPLDIATLRRSRGTFRGIKIAENTGGFSLFKRPQERDGTVTFYIRQAAMVHVEKPLQEAIRKFLLTGTDPKANPGAAWKTSFLLRPQSDAKAQPLLLSISRNRPWVMLSGSYSVADDIYQDDSEAAPTIISQSPTLYDLLEDVGR
jgi:hypothetical protein